MESPRLETAIREKPPRPSFVDASLYREIFVDVTKCDRDCNNSSVSRYSRVLRRRTLDSGESFAAVDDKIPPDECVETSANWKRLTKCGHARALNP